MTDIETKVATCTWCGSEYDPQEGEDEIFYTESCREDDQNEHNEKTTRDRIEASQ